MSFRLELAGPGKAQLSNVTEKMAPIELTRSYY
jgi:hypothetical protein